MSKGFVTDMLLSWFQGFSMVICFNCSMATKQQLDLLLSKGEYADYGDAIAAAIANQAVLSEQVWERGALVIPAENSVAADGSAATKKAGSRTRGRNTIPGLIGPSSFEVPPLFRRAGLDGAVLDFPEQPLDACADGPMVPPSRWLWGQFNRFLPAKVSCRALARLQMESPAGVLLAEAAQNIAKEAADLGDYLIEYDRRFNLKRDEAVAIAFPHSGPDLWKSQQRYAGQFVGSVNTEGVVSGMLIDLKLLSCFSTRDGIGVRLTQAGWQLAQLVNPILDSVPLRPGKRLGEEEIDFLIRHIRNFVRAEDSAYRALLRSIGGGSNTPTALDDAVEVLNGKEATQMSRAFVSTQRSGAIARMADLGLIVRIRDGLAVTYSIAERGHSYADLTERLQV